MSESLATMCNGHSVQGRPVTANPVADWLLNDSVGVLEDQLHVIVVVSNPILYARRYILAREFLARMAATPCVCTYVVELAYGAQEYYVAEAGNPRHLRLHAHTAPLWHKENMINIGVRTLLPPTWRAFAWIDADVEFDCPTWPRDALRLLNGRYDVLQLFSHAVDMNQDEDAMSIFPSFAFQHVKGKVHSTGKSACNLWHPGFAWAMTRAAFDAIGGLFQRSILGSGDFNMAMALIGKVTSSVNALASKGYLSVLKDFQSRCAAARLRLGYVPGVLRHHYHGQKALRKYQERWQVLVKHQYDPRRHVQFRADGLLEPSPACPAGLLSDILAYFAERNEDEGLGVAAQPVPPPPPPLPPLPPLRSSPVAPAAPATSEPPSDSSSSSGH